MRRPKGEGTYEKLPKGRVRLVVIEGGEKLKGPSSATKKEAKEAWREKFIVRPAVESADRKQAPGKSIRSLILMLFPADYPDTKVKHELTIHIETVWAGSTLDGFRKSMMAIGARPIGLRTLKSLDRPYLQNWVDGLGLKPRTVHNYYNNLKRLGQLFKVEIPDVLLPAIGQVDGEILETGDWGEFLAYAENDLERAALIMLFRCGMRGTEACGARTEHYNPKTRALEVQRSASKIKGKVDVRPTTKTERTRKIPIRSAWLREYIESAPPGYLLHRGNPEEPYSSNALGNLMRRRLKGTKFEGISPQDLRRSAATAYALANVPIEGAAAIMGHSSKMLKDVYANVKIHVKEELMDKAFGGGD